MTEVDEPGGWQLDWEPIAKVGAPQRLPPARDAVYAEVPARAAAFLIDVTIALALGQLASQVLGLLAAWWSRETDGSAQDSALLMASVGHFLFSLLITLTAAYMWRTFRATPGQLALRIHVLRAGTGRRLSRASALGRWALVYLPLAFVMSYQTIGTALARIPLTADVDQFMAAGGALFVPLLWWLVLALSTRADGRRGRGLHDRLAGSVVVRRVAG